MKIEKIVSKNNETVKRMVKLQDKSYRTEHKLFCFEGYLLAAELKKAGIPAKKVFMTERFYEENKAFSESLSDEIYIVTDEVYKKITLEASPQGIFVLCSYIDNIKRNAPIKKSMSILLESIRDAGNLGTIIRTAAAFGIPQIILSGDCADIYNPKTLRACMGSLFYTQINICDDFVSAVNILKGMNQTVNAAVLSENSISLIDYDIKNGDCFIIGNEGSGISDVIKQAATNHIKIPQTEQAESLNAANAAAVIMWEMSKKLKTK